jgi:serine/threonine-protein kinase
MHTSSNAARVADAQPDEMIDGRYRVVATLGKGGMAVVYDVHDTATGERRALKRLVPPEGPEKRIDAVAFFEREFFTLSQLGHPRIVDVYDYGVDAIGPYYTMELLDGGDLQRMAPVPWRNACAYGRDVCSALALVHSRRMVYRDLSPRNVRRTNDGLAKLIDFGAMGPMGPAKELIGTLPCCAPESLDLQPLDARTDLYALGATLYYTLVGRHAYPGRDFQQLAEMWRTRPRRPSEIVAGIPEALDALLLGLMSPDPAMRPASAAEVMERLSVIAGLPSDEQLHVSRAYLSTPTLFGRETELSHIRKIVARAQRRRGASVVVRGLAGSGRSRLLDALVLEGKLAGATVLRADPSDAVSGSYGVARAIAAQLLRLLPDVAFAAAEPHIAVLGHVAPELLEKYSGVVLSTFEDAHHMARRVQPAFRQWLSDIGRKRALIVAIDDLHRIDETSAALFAIMANEVSQRSILVAATLESRASVPPHLASVLKLFTGASTAFDIEALSEEHARQLLGSIFGEQPNLARLAHRLFAIAAGNPRDLLRLAQHLVDDNVLRYQAGAWILPEAIEQIELPTSMGDALRERVAALPEDARELVLAVAFAPGERFTFDECLVLSGHEQRGRLAKSIDDLVAREMFLEAGAAFHLGRAGSDSALREGVSEERARATHQRLARVFGKRGDGLRQARHLLLAAEHATGLDVFVAFCIESELKTNTSSDAFVKLIQSVPDDWFHWFEEALRLAVEGRRPAKDVHAIRSRLSGLVAMAGSAAAPHLEALVAELHRECGLDIYDSLDPTLDAGQRLATAMGGAWKRHMETPEAERTVDPTTALTKLARALAQSIGLLAISGDYEGWKRLPSLRAFAPVSPALAVVDQLVQGVGARIAGRIEQCLQLYKPLLERLAQPDRAGLDESHHRHTRLRVMQGVCLLQATMGVTPDPAMLRELETDAFYEPSALLVRMVSHVWRGEVQEADRRKKDVELLQIQTRPRTMSDGTHLLSELVAYAFMDDLTRVKRTLESVEAMAKDHAPWMATVHYGKGEYNRIRGDHASALEELDASLSMMVPGQGRAWPHAAGARLMALIELGRLEEAKSAAEQYSSIAAFADIGYAKSYVDMPRSLVLAKLGHIETAEAMSDRVIALFESLGIAGLNLATAHEFRARVAVEAQDQSAFEKHAALAGALGRRRGLSSAKYALLVQRVGTVDGIGALTGQDSVLSQFSSLLATCKSAGERAERGLDMLVRSSGAVGGVLYALSSKGVVRRAQVGRLVPDEKIDALARDYMQTEMNDANETQVLEDAAAVTALSREWKGPGETRYVPVLVSNSAKQGLAISGVVMLLVEGAARFSYPAALASELSRLCHEAGDFSVTIV